MRRHARSVFALVLLAAAATLPASARTVVVPDDFPTIQEAVDSLGTSWHPDTLLVRGGSYPERLVIQGQHIVIQGIPPLDGSDRMPEIQELRAGGGDDSGRYHFIGLHFTGAVTVGLSEDDFGFAGCRLDGGLSTAGGASVVWLFKCTSLQNVQIVAEDGFLDSCTVHGSAAIDASYQAQVYGNHFENSSGTAVVIHSESVNASHNRVRGGDHAFELYSETGFQFEGNDIEGCRGWGVHLESRGSDPVEVERNRIVDCGGFGLRAIGAIVLRDNRVIGCRADGLLLFQDYDQGIVVGNIVGRCVGAGISVHAEGFAVERNTVYECGGPGILVSCYETSTIANNIVYATHGLSVAGMPAVLSGNDWFPAFGVTPSPTDLAVDPRFCDLAADDVRLRSDSPLLDVPGHRRIGALGQGCEPPPLAIGFELSPRVLQPTARTPWVTAWLEPPVEFPIADIDVASVRVNGVPVAPGTDVFVGDRDRDGVPDLQLRFDRAALEATLASGDALTVTLHGNVGKRIFTGTDVIRVLRYGSRSSVPRPWMLSIQAPPVGRVAGRLHIAFTLADMTPAHLDVLDVAGRVVATRDVGKREPGEYALELAGPGGFAPGIYFLRLRQGTNEARTRMTVLR